jgi:hypothetical protein
MIDKIIPIGRDLISRVIQLHHLHLGLPVLGGPVAKESGINLTSGFGSDGDMIDAAADDKAAGGNDNSKGECSRN